jgi:hypothetical protein
MYAAQVYAISKHIVPPVIFKHAQVSMISWFFVMRDLCSQHIVAPMLIRSLEPIDTQRQLHKDVNSVPSQFKLKVTFCRCFHYDLMLMWYDLISIAPLCLTNETDAIIWKYESKGILIRLTV